MGQRFTLSDRFSIELGLPCSRQFDIIANIADRPRVIEFPITITNEGQQLYAFDEVSLAMRVTFDRNPVPRIYDSEGGVNQPPLRTVFPGTSFAYRAAFAV